MARQYKLALDVDYAGVYSGAQLPKVERNNHQRRCRICNKLLSSYNIASEYCFAHQVEGQRIDDQKEEEKRRRINKKSTLKTKREREERRGDDKNEPNNRRRPKNNKKRASIKADSTSKGLANKR